MDSRHMSYGDVIAASAHVADNIPATYFLRLPVIFLFLFLHVLQGCAQPVVRDLQAASSVEDTFDVLEGRDEALLAMRAKVDHSRAMIKCGDPGAPEHPQLVVGVKTNRFYHSTRVKALWNAWGHTLGHALVFVTDSPLLEAAEWPASVIVDSNAIDADRREAYVPPWRLSGDNPADVDPFALPQLTRRVAALFEVMYSCWGNSAKWYILVDDDTFVRPDVLLRLMKDVDAKEYHFLGRPTNSDQFTLPRHMAAHGSSIHCGGSSILLSAPLVQRIVEISSDCLHGPPRTTLAWYWDEVELLGRCLYERLHLNCTELPTPRSTKIMGEIAMGSMMSVGGQADYDALDSYVTKVLKGEWNRLSLATLHPVEAPYMRWLGRRFKSSTVVDALPDNASVRKGNERHAEEL